MNKALLIFNKDWREVLHSRGLMVTIIIIPLLFGFYAVGLSMVTGVGGFGDSKVQGAIVSEALFILISFSVTLSVASNSIVGEKQDRTLEPLLATPIEIWQLMLGKALVSIIPGLASAWIVYCIYVALAQLFATPTVAALVISVPYLLIIFLLSPLITTLVVLSTIIISSMVSDTRTARQISGFIITPLVLLFIGQALGSFTVDIGFTFSTCLVVLVLDAVGLWLSIRLFQREAILTRWK